MARDNSVRGRGIAFAGAASLVAAGVVSATTGESTDWAWGAMVLTTIIGLLLLTVALIAMWWSRRPSDRLQGR